jgi:ATP-binding cassette, subfamily B, bacterial
MNASVRPPGPEDPAQSNQSENAWSASASVSEANGDETFTYDQLFEKNRNRSFRELPSLTHSSIRLIVRAAKREFIAVSVLQVFLALFGALQLLAMRRLLGQVLGLGTTTKVGDVLPWGSAVVGLVTASGIAGLARSEVQRVLTDLVAREAQIEVANAASTAQLIDFDRAPFHNRLQRVLANSTMRPMQLTSGLISIVGAALSIIAVVITLGAIEPILVGVALIGAIPLVLSTRITTRLSIDFEVEQTEVARQRDYLLFLLSQKDSAKEIRAYNLAGYLSGRYAGLWTARINRLRVVAGRRLKVGTVARLLTGAVTACVLFSLAHFLERGSVTLPEAVVAAGAIVLLAQRAQMLVSGFGLLFECTAFLKEVERFLDEAKERRSGMAERPKFSVQAETPLEVRAERVVFRYPNASDNALRGVDIVVRTGEVVALVGPNGSGKTTLAKLLGGLYEPLAGEVCWNGCDVRSVDDVSLREHVAFVFQDYVRFFLSAAENIGFGRWQRADDRDGLAAAARRAGAGFLESFPLGYETLLAPQFSGGRDLSLGQWQRVALARAFFRDAELVILDEPSSALDPEAEAALFDSLRELCVGKAVIVISHRFSTVSSADRIYVLERGAVVEAGTHRELMDLEGTYERLFKLQAEAYLR